MNSCNSCKRLGTSRLHELHESKFPFVSRIEFIRSKLSNFSAHVYGDRDAVLCAELPEQRVTDLVAGITSWAEVENYTGSRRSHDGTEFLFHPS